MIISAEVAKLYPFHINKDGQKEWTALQGDKYVVTGVDRNGKRFRRTYDSWKWAAGVNLWQGSKWLERGGKRWLISRTSN